MNYQKIYDALIARAVSLRGHPKSRHSQRKGYSNHHIIPASWFAGGRKDPEANVPINLVWLTHREHFIAHWLLARLYGGEMSHAFALMCGDKRHYKGMMKSSKAYSHHLTSGLECRSKSQWAINVRAARARYLADPERFAENLKRLTEGREKPETKAKIIASNKRRANDPDWLKKNSMINGAMRNCPDYVQNHREAIKRFHAKPESKEIAIAAAKKRLEDPEFRAKNSAHLKAMAQTPEWKAKMKAVLEQRRADPDWESFNREKGRQKARLLIGTPIEGDLIIYIKGNRDQECLGFIPSAITQCLKGKSNFHKGHTWRHANEEELRHWESMQALDPDWHDRMLKTAADYLNSPFWLGILAKIVSEEAGHRGMRNSRLVIGIPKEGSIPAYFLRGATMIKANGFSSSGITECLMGRRVAHKGYTWREATPEELERWERDNM
ncbi:TPA: hypothetical protein LU109_003570 [Enterobacter hormaechei subsp. xiangfangensis]|nr:hypothetical protein [Enterobacter hormaechei subsp. xiangfangensis]